MHPDTEPDLKQRRGRVTIQVVDLIDQPAVRSSWRRWRSVSAVDVAEAATKPAAGDSLTPVERLSGRPSPGYSFSEETAWFSPMGYELAPVGEGKSPITGSRIVLVLTPEEDAVDPAIEAPPTLGRLGRPPQTIRLKGPEGELVLTIGRGPARVVASTASWAAMSEPVLLAVCLCWRFQAIDAELDRLTLEAEGDLPHATMAVPSSLRNRKRLLGHARAIRAVMIDLPHFAGPLTDPYPYLSGDLAVPTFRSLAEKLHLEGWGESIDDRAEAVEDVYASVTEKLNEFRNFAIGSILEVTIIVILLVEFAIITYDTFSP